MSLEPLKLSLYHDGKVVQDEGQVVQESHAGPRVIPGGDGVLMSEEPL